MWQKFSLWTFRKDDLDWSWFCSFPNRWTLNLIVLHWDVSTLQFALEGLPLMFCSTSCICWKKNWCRKYVYCFTHLIHRTTFVMKCSVQMWRVITTWKEWCPQPVQQLQAENHEKILHKKNLCIQQVVSFKFPLWANPLGTSSLMAASPSCAVSRSSLQKNC